MVKKNHEAVVLGEKIDPGGTKNRQGRRLEAGAEERERPGAEGWDTAQKHWGVFSSLLRTSKMISRSQGINLCVSSPPCEAAVTSLYPHTVTKINAGCRRAAEKSREVGWEVGTGGEQERKTQEERAPCERGGRKPMKGLRREMVS